MIKYFFFGLIFLNLMTLDAQQLRVLYFNDAHELAAVEYKGQKLGGIAKLSQLIHARRDANTIVLFGGDLAGGTLGGKFFKGSVMVKALNQIGIDAANPGQHEFDWGIDNFIQLKHQSKFPWVSSHLIYPEDTTLWLPFHRLKKGDLTIGILGLTDKLETSQPGLPLHVLPMLEQTRKIIQQHPEVKFWIALTQMSLEKNETLHEQFPEIQLILTEETHQDRTQIIWHENTPIIAASGNAADVVEVNVTAKGKSIEIIPIRPDTADDSFMKSWITDSIQMMNYKLSQGISYAEKPFLKEETKFGERAIGNLVADAFKSYYHADIGIIHGGGIREGIKQGQITLKDIYAILPFENDLILAELTGKEIHTLLETSMQRMMPQVSGIKLLISHDKPKIDTILKNHTPLLDTETYQVSLPAYIADGGGDYTPIDSSKILKRSALDADALRWYLQQSTVWKPVLDGRIQQ